MTIQSNFPAIRPALDLNFAASEVLDPRVTFTRASTATYYGTQTAKAEENLFTYSQEFNNAAWFNNIGTITANAGNAPDGTATAEKIVPFASSSSFKELRQFTNIVSGLTYAYSVFLKADGYQYVQLVGNVAQFGSFAINIDLSTGTETQYTAGTSTVISRGITAEGNGWYRVNVVITAIGSGSAQITWNAIPASNSSRGVVWTPNATSGYLVWGAQLEQRSSVTAYTPTTTQPITNYIPVLQTALAGVPRFDHNPTTFESLGLLVEEQRTNLWTRSGDFDNANWIKVRSSIQSNVIVAPDGTLTGDKFISNTDNNTHFVRQDAAIVTGTTYTQTVYAKAAEYNQILLAFNTDGSQFADGAAYFTLTGAGTVLINGTLTSSSITSVGNGWYRCQISATATNTLTGIFRIHAATSSNIIFTGDGYNGVYIWGAQLEAGAFPTSYIPTVASQVTRSADAASMTGTNFSWYRADEGTIYCEAATVATDSIQRRAVSINDATTNNYIDISRIGSTAQSRAAVVANGTTVFNSLTSAWDVNTFAKVTNAYKVNDFAAVLNAGTVRTDNDGVLPVVSQLVIGNITTNNQWVGTIKRIAYYPARLTNAQLQAITG